MRTNFTNDQLLQPLLQAAESELRSCVHCGICTATCPTYVLLGNELDGPRGRIQLIQQMLETNVAPSQTVVSHIDRCLSCLACVSACPSGVDYRRLIDTARIHIEKNHRRPFLDWAMRQALGFVLPRRRWFSALLRLARMTSGLMRALPNQLARLQRSGVQLPRPHDVPPAQKLSAPKDRIALHYGCVQEVIAPQINQSVRRVLAFMNIDAVAVEGEGCCGGLNHHLGQERQAKRLGAALTADVSAAKSDHGCGAFLTSTSGCGAVIRDYSFMLGTNEASSVEGMTWDALEYVAENLKVTTTPASSIRVAYHQPCSLQHGMKDGKRGPELLRRMGYDVVEPQDQTCCGAAGIYNILQPEIADALRAQKVTALTAANPDVIVSCNIGCLVHVANAANIPIHHPIELVDWALTGSLPTKFKHIL